MSSRTTPLHRTHALTGRLLLSLGLALIAVAAMAATATAAPVSALSSSPFVAPEPPYLPVSLRLAVAPPPWAKCLGGTAWDEATSIQQTADKGYILTGFTYSNDGNVTGNHGKQDAWVVKLSSKGSVQWQRCLGGSENDYAESIQQTAEGGYILAGYTRSSNDDVKGNHGSSDAWVVKLSSKGSVQWQRCLGGSEADGAYSIRQTADKGYILAGYTSSSNGDVKGYRGGGDAWVVKLSSKGSVQWKKCLGGTGEDFASSIHQTTDKGYILAGFTSSSNGDVKGYHGNGDAWVVKLSSKGTVQWKKCLGGTDYDKANSIHQTTDKGYILAGSTLSDDGDAIGNHGSYDAWVVKLSSKGTIQWRRCFGGTDWDKAASIHQAADGDYILAGFTASNNGDVAGNHGDYDAWVVKLSARGAIQWRSSLGGTEQDSATSVQQTAEGGYILAGSTRSDNGDVSGNRGNNDVWVAKLSSKGTVQWQKCLGGAGNDYAYSIHQTTDKGYILAGETTSNNGDVKGNHGDHDAWVVKLSSNGTVQWQRCLGGSENDYAYSIRQTTDKGYILAGYTYSSNGDVKGNHGNGDAWVVKLSSKGTIQWQRCLGGLDWDEAYSIHQTTDKGYILAGSTGSNDGDVKGNHGNGDAWVVKLSSKGSVQWKKCLGGSEDDGANSIRQTTDKGYILAGRTSSNNGDVKGNHGSPDAWVVKLSSRGIVQWQRCLGGSVWDGANSIHQTAEGGYILAGRTSSNNGDVKGNHGSYDAWVVKLSSRGIVQWQRCLGGSDWDAANSIHQTTDKGYILAGYIGSNDGDVKGNHGSRDAWVVKLK